jgi:hypothetical protein
LGGVYPDSGLLGRAIGFYFRPKKRAAYFQGGKKRGRSLDTNDNTKDGTVARLIGDPAEVLEMLYG